jgi:outer membrane protein assembly factor BamA
MTVEAEDEAYSVKERGQWLSTWRALSLNRRFYWGLGGALERERLHVAGVGSSPVQDERVLGLVAGIDTRRQRWLSEGPSEGQQLRLFAETSRGLGGTYSGSVYRADWRGYVPLRKTVLALRWNEAYGEADAEPFQLGGSFSDDAFTLPLLNDREFALRGYTSGAPELTGRRARVTTVEWRMPLADVDRHRVVPPVGLNRVSLNLFADFGAAWEPGTRPDYHRGFGVEVMSELRIGYLFGIHARAGIARGVDETGKTTGYLRVGRSF